MDHSPLDVLDEVFSGPGKAPTSIRLPKGHEKPGPTGYEVDDFSVGDVVMFKTNAQTAYGPHHRHAAPTGALARVVAIEPDNWPGMIGVHWADQWGHGQQHGGYYAFMFWPANPDDVDTLDARTAPEEIGGGGVQPDIFDMLSEESP